MASMETEGGLWGEEDPELYANDATDDEMPEDGNDGAAASAGPAEERTFLPGDVMPKDMELTFDPSAYLTYNEWNTEWPCLSFDVLPDGLGTDRTTFPMVAYLVSGTQTDTGDKDELLVMKVSEVKQTKGSSIDDDDESDDEDEDEPAKLSVQGIKHKGSVNRVKVCPHPGSVVASWADTGKVHIWDVSQQVKNLDKDQKPTRAVKQKPLHTFSGHAEEGYGLSWSSVVPYRLASGDNAGAIHVWDRQADGAWAVNATPCTAHTNSVEDIAWSPSEQNVFVSASSDGTLRVWDVRAGNRCAITVQAHDTDVNAVSWNRCEQHLLASGADDGSFRVWDLRTFMSAGKDKPVEPVASFEWHTKAVTSVEWHPTDASVICVSGEDDQLTIWDMAVEQDLEAQTSAEGGRQDVPPQLLFIHQGQSNVKEAHWHRQLPGVVISTAESGFNLFKTISVTQ